MQDIHILINLNLLISLTLEFKFEVDKLYNWFVYNYFLLCIYNELYNWSWTQLNKKEQRQLKERRNKDMTTVEPVQRVAKRSYPCLLFHYVESWRKRSNRRCKGAVGVSPSSFAKKYYVAWWSKTRLWWRQT